MSENASGGLAHRLPRLPELLAALADAGRHAIALDTTRQVLELAEELARGGVPEVALCASAAWVACAHANRREPSSFNEMSEPKFAEGHFPNRPIRLGTVSDQLAD